MKFLILIVILLLLADLFLHDSRLLSVFDDYLPQIQVLKWILIIGGAISATFLMANIMFDYFKDLPTPDEEEEEEEIDEKEEEEKD